MKKTLVTALVVLTALTACKSQYEALRESNDVDAKYAAAFDYFNQGKYSKAADLFESPEKLTSSEVFTLTENTFTSSKFPRSFTNSSTISAAKYAPAIPGDAEREFSSAGLASRRSLGSNRKRSAMGASISGQSILRVD